MSAQHYRLPIHRKLFLFFLGSIIVPLLVFGTFLFRQQGKIFQSEVSASAQREIVQMAERLSLEFSHISSISNLLYLDQQISDFLLAYQSGAVTVPTRINQLISRYSAGFTKMNAEAVVVAMDGKVFGEPLLLRQTPRLSPAEHAWWSQLEARPSGILWVNDPVLDAFHSSPAYPYTYLIRRLENPKTWQPLGVLIIGVPELELKKMYLGYVNDRQSTYLFDRNNQIVSFVDNLETNPGSRLSPDEYASYSGYYTATDQGTDLLVNHYTISATQWKLVTCSSLDHLMESFADILTMFLMILLAYLLITVALSLIMARRFVLPINNLYAAIVQVQQGKLKVRAPITTNDEIADLSSQFNAMMDEIHDLMGRIVYEQKRKREAEIISLQAQIKPHFLYNTLASIRFLVYSGDAKAADEVLLALIRLMKYTLSDANEFVSVEREMRLLDDYIYIQKLAFARPIDITISIDTEILDCMIQKLILQPIVENAFYHGLKSRKDACRLTIEGKAEDDEVLFTVRDNGIGFPTDKRNVMDLVHDTRSIGLRNVHSRIQLAFGEAYGVTVGSAEDGGALVSLRIPMIREKGDYSSYEHFDR